MRRPGRDAWLVAGCLVLLGASPWIWKNGRELWLAGRWWLGVSGAEDALVEGKIVWPFRLACSSRDPLRRWQGLAVLGFHEGLVPKEEAEARFLSAVRDSGIVEFPEPDQYGDRFPSGFPVGSHVVYALRNGGIPHGEDFVRTHFSALLADFENPQVHPRIRGALADLLVRCGGSDSPDPWGPAEADRICRALKAAMRDRNVEVRSGVVFASIEPITHWKRDELLEDVIPALLELIESSDEGRRRAAADNLNELLLCTVIGTAGDRAHWEEALARERAREAVEAASYP